CASVAEDSARGRSGSVDAEHDFGRFHEHGDARTDFELELLRGLLRDRRADRLSAVELDLDDRHHAAGPDRGDLAGKLVANGQTHVVLLRNILLRKKNLWWRCARMSRLQSLHD